MNISASKLASIIFSTKNKSENTSKPLPTEISTDYIIGRYYMIKEIPKIQEKCGTILEKSRVYQHSKYSWLSCKPDSISTDNEYLLKLKYTTKTKLCITYYDWIYLQIIMEITNVNKTIYAMGTSTHYTIVIIDREKSWWNIIEKSMIKNGVLNISNTRCTRQNTPFISSKIPVYNLHPLFNNDLLSYSLFQMNIQNEKSNSQLYLINEYNKKYSNSLLEKYSGSSKIIPISYKHDQYLEVLTKRYLNNEVDIVFNPMMAFDNYFYQSFALWKNKGKYTAVFIAKKADKFIHNIIINIYRWCDTNGIPHESDFVLLYDGIHTVINTDKTIKLISEYKIPTNFKLYKNGVIPIKNSRYFNSTHNTIIKEHKSVNMLLGIGPIKAMELHKLKINTIDDYRNSNQVKTSHQENILMANHDNCIYPKTLLYSDILKKYNNEAFIDIEFCPSRIVTLVMKNNKGIVKKWNLCEFTNDYEKEMIIEIITELNQYDIVYHWGHADKTVLKKAIDRLGINIKLPNMYDVYIDMKRNELAIPNCWNMKLKSIAKSLYDKKLINTFHTDVLDGQDMVCQFIKWDRFEEFYDNKGDIIQKILEYNYYDVETMMQIILWYRNHFN
jgi:hypothetical protein